jgi:uncharacterized protein
VFVAFLLLAAARAWRAGDAGAMPRRVATAPRPVWHGLWIGAAGGAFSGLLGIGGGVVMVPLLVAALDFDQHEAQATSLAAMLPPIGLPGVLVYERASGGLPWALVGALAAGYGVGGFVGARLATRASGARLSRAFALFVLLVAAGMTWRLVGGD